MDDLANIEAKMQEIASYIQEGAKAYMNRQYSTIVIVALVLVAILFVTFSTFALIVWLFIRNIIPEFSFPLPIEITTSSFENNPLPLIL